MFLKKQYFTLEETKKTCASAKLPANERELANKECNFLFPFGFALVFVALIAPLRNNEQGTNSSLSISAPRFTNRAGLREIRTKEITFNCFVNINFACL
jgi:hypothetical protein